MDKIDNTLFGWGIDFLYIICNGLKKKKSYAIIHKVVCKNPFEKDKKIKIREWNNIEGVNKEKINWETFAKNNKIPDNFETIVYDSIIDNSIQHNTLVTNSRLRWGSRKRNQLRIETNFNKF